MSEEASNVPNSPQPLVDHQQAETSTEPVLSFAQTLNPEPAVDSGSAVDSKPAPNPDPAFNPEPALNPAFALGTESSPNPEHSPDPDPALNSEPAPNSEPALESEPVLTSKVNRSSGPISTSSLASEPDSPLTPCSGDDLEPTGDVPAAGIPEQHPTDRPAVDNGQQPIYVDGEDQKAYERVTHIPPEISALFPSPMDSVESLISHNSFSPQPIGGKRLRPAKSCIVDSGVRWRKEDLLTAPIPPLQWIGDLEMELKAQLGAGRHPSALQHPTIPDLRLPLWMVSLWFVIQAIEAQKALWTEAVTWLSSDAVTGEEVDRASELIKQLKWGTTIWPLLEPTMLIGLVAELFRDHWPSSAEVYLAGGNPPAPGSLFANPALAATYQRILEEAEAASHDRDEQIEAARRVYYDGFVAETIAGYVASADVMDVTGRPHRGLLSYEDLAGWRPRLEEPLTYDVGGLTVCKTKPWGQGPVFLQQLALLDGFDLTAMGPGTADYVHTVTECAKLAFADREAWYGDPDFTDVPVKALLSAEYADDRRLLVGPEASAELRPGAPEGRTPRLPGFARYSSIAVAGRSPAGHTSPT